MNGTAAVLLYLYVHTYLLCWLILTCIVYFIQEELYGVCEAMYKRDMVYLSLFMDFLIVMNYSLKLFFNLTT